MQETEFIAQNREKWKEFEGVLGSTNKDPNRLTSLFIETTDDLSYSRTYYANRSIRVYLNGIAQQVYQAIYRNKSRGKNRWSRFWIQELPQALWHARSSLLISFLVFAGGVSIGIISSIYHPEFARIVLGDQYVEMTEANIQHGDPMAVYKDSPPLEMFFRIALNNIRVGFMAFLLGITFGIGTYYIILSNAIMVGTFIYFFIERGLFRDAFLAVMLHGTLELSMIVLSGAAGLVLARGLLFPGTFTRGQALIHSARAGIKIMIAVSIFLVYAAIIESFATRFTDLPEIAGGKTALDIARLIVILFSLAIVVGYFVIYPAMRYRSGRISAPENEDLPPSRVWQPGLSEIKSSGRIFTESFLLFGRCIKPALAISLTGAMAFSLAFLLFTKGDLQSIISNYSGEVSNNPLGFFWVWDNFDYHFQLSAYPWVLPVSVLIFSVWTWLASSILFRTLYGRSTTMKWSHLGRIILLTTLTAIPFLLPIVLALLIELFLFPVSMFLILATHPGGLGISLTDSLGLLRGGYVRLITVFSMIFFIQWLGLILLYADFSWIVLDFIQINLPHDSWLSIQLPYLLYTFLIAFLPLILFSLSIYAIGLFLFSQREINEATELKKSISEIGYKRRAYGLEKES